MNERPYRPYPIKTTVPAWEDGWSLGDYVVAVLIHVENLARHIHLLNTYIHYLEQQRENDNA